MKFQIRFPSLNPPPNFLSIMLYNRKERGYAETSRGHMAKSKLQADLFMGPTCLAKQPWHTHKANGSPVQMLYLNT